MTDLHTAITLESILYSERSRWVNRFRLLCFRFSLRAGPVGRVSPMRGIDLPRRAAPRGVGRVPWETGILWVRCVPRAPLRGPGRDEQRADKS